MIPEPAGQWQGAEAAGEPGVAELGPGGPPDAERAKSACRPRGAILAATLELLAEHGFDGASIDGIAARAGVGKATIYRHWGSKAGLVIDACATLPGVPSVPATGSLSGDLEAVLHALVAHLGHPTRSRILTSLVDAAQRDPELAALHRAFIDRRRAPLRRVLEAAVERGELAAGVDLDLAVDLLAGPLVYRHLLWHEPISPGFVQEVVAAALAHLRPG